MPAYVMLANWTDQGARQVKESPKRLDAAKKALTEMGGEFKSLYMTLGEYDIVVDLRGARRRRRGPLQPAARATRRRAHDDDEGIPRGRLSRDHQLARLRRPT